jgi:putative isomerase
MTFPEGTPFSRRGSYFSVSGTPELRTVRGDARNREIARLGLDGGKPALRVRPEQLEMTRGDARAELALDGAGRALIRVVSGTLELEFDVRDQYDVVLRESERAWRFIDSGANRNYRFWLASGTARHETGWDGERDTWARLSVTGPALLVVDEYGSVPPPSEPVDFDQVLVDALQDFLSWAQRHGAGAAGRTASYVTWSALVPAGGLLRRESMLMSKNRMTNIWSWDHCFNALALWRDPAAAADQLLTLFDHQDEHGCLPDYVNDAGVERNFVKPPVHGWAIGLLMDRGGLTSDVVEALHEPLSRWTDWWFAHRDHRGDGVPSYHHGNDSGWDNSTVFAEGVPVQSPDLLACLALQMSVLARIGDSAYWQARTEDTIKALIGHFWLDGRFVARHTLTGEPIRSDSLLTLMPLILGDLLPSGIFDTTVRRLAEGGYLTDHGPATEPPHSPHYVADGYWRGPIWAPTTLMLVDGLRRGGRPDLAADITGRFLKTCATSGMAENFDALTGAPLRDPSMTWTASAYLYLAGT